MRSLELRNGESIWCLGKSGISTRESFYTRCKTRADRETDPTMKQRLISLASNVNKIDEAMEKHDELLKEIQDSPTDLDAIVAKRRKDFTGDFFRFLALLSETYDNLEDRDGVARLVAKCMSAVSAFDKTLESLETLDAAQAKFDDILNSSSVDAACEKIKSLAKAKELDSSLILLINSAWAAAKESTSVKNEILKSDSQLWQQHSPQAMTMKLRILMLYTRLPRSCTNGLR
ncbi:FOLATE RECEPTOR-LIKE [Salix viminalis]|uniref:FOLATE RECEPTOR-LIKE n=1 Tax=Salix viminalis TaxID=40686 RepID=A0A9Q0SIN6_SALVM|nr:FOLATE RECEPTOR-LIKE [Salix viminalis]